MVYRTPTGQGVVLQPAINSVRVTFSGEAEADRQCEQTPTGGTQPPLKMSHGSTLTASDYRRLSNSATDRDRA